VLAAVDGLLDSLLHVPLGRRIVAQLGDSLGKKDLDHDPQKRDERSSHGGTEPIKEWLEGGGLDSDGLSSGFHRHFPSAGLAQDCLKPKQPRARQAGGGQDLNGVVRDI
jgi:hypothetical protein